MRSCVGLAEHYYCICLTRNGRVIPASKVAPSTGPGEGAYGFKRSTLEFVHVSNDCLIVMYYWLEKRRRVGTEEATLYDRILSAAKRATVGT